MTITKIVLSYKEKNVMFVEKKVVTLINIQIINNKRQKNFENKIENSTEIKANIMHFWLIIKRIQMMILMILIKKQIIQKTIIKITCNIL